MAISAAVNGQTIKRGGHRTYRAQLSEVNATDLVELINQKPLAIGILIPIRRMALQNHIHNEHQVRKDVHSLQQVRESMS